MAGKKAQPGRDKEKRNERWTLFDAGALGSELALVKSMFETLGTPNESTWPVRSLPIHIPLFY